MNAHEQTAYDLGVEHAKTAASWIVNGNMSTDVYHAALALLEAGDLDALNAYLPARPNLSGEWADSPTPQSLAADIIGADWETHGNNAPDFIPAEQVDALADAYEEGVSATFETECERILRDAIA